MNQPRITDMAGKTIAVFQEGPLGSGWVMRPDNESELAYMQGVIIALPPKGRK